MSKITFGKSEPFNSGWKGWSDYVEVYLDGKKIGQLEAVGCDHKRYLNYTFESDHPAARHVSTLGHFGLRASKAAVRDAFAALAKDETKSVLEAIKTVAAREED